jgi:hypothetical protein
MKFPSLKLKKDHTPKLSSMRPPIFDVDSRWYKTLGMFFIALLVIMLVGFKLFYSVYYETYKTEGSAENYNSLIGVNRLNDAIDKRQNFLDKQIDLPRDPSI